MRFIYLSNVYSLLHRSCSVKLICIIFLAGEILWLWWFDRQGTLQSWGISYIQDFPRFLVLLLALRRFRQCHWGVPNGYPTTMKDPEGEVPTLYFPEYTEQLLKDGPENLAIAAHTVTPKWSQPVMKRFQLHGRATRVYGAEIDGNDNYVLKISHPEIARVPEARIVRIARTRKPKSFMGKDDHKFDLKEHLPNVICSMDIPGSDTSQIRQVLGLKGIHAGRVCRLLVSEKLKPITDLEGWDFILGWCHIIHCMLSLCSVFNLFTHIRFTQAIICYGRWAFTMAILVLGIWHYA
jgi:hypothetical protein